MPILEPEIKASILTIFKNCETQLLNNGSDLEFQLTASIKVQGETIMKMKIGDIMRDSSVIESQFKEIENMISTATQDEWFKKALAASILGNVFRYLDFENFLKPY